jgi:hypothetical protein
MTQQDVFEKVLDALNKSGINYMITGSIASITYGKPRVTHDMDLVAQITPEQSLEFAKLLGKEFYMDLIDVKESLQQNRQFNIIHPSTGLKIDCWPLKDAYDRFRFTRRLQKPFGNISAYYASPEDVIIGKLKWLKQGGSARHIEDIKGILSIQGDRIDHNYIINWAEKLELKEFLKEIGVN